MVRKKKLPKDSPESILDVFEAIKRALIKRGLFRDKSRKHGAPKDEPKRLSEVAANAHEILIKANTVFPFTLFPDTVTLDREKVTIAQRYFWRVAQISGSPIINIQNVQANVGPFFGSLTITSKFFENNQKTINFLSRDDANRLRDLLQGYVIAIEQGIECSHIPKHRLLKLLYDLGKGDTG